MATEWTPEALTEVRAGANELVDKGYTGVAMVLHSLVNTVEAQQAELAAARELYRSVRGVDFDDPLDGEVDRIVEAWGSYYHVLSGRGIERDVGFDALIRRPDETEG